MIKIDLPEMIGPVCKYEFYKLSQKDYGNMVGIYFLHSSSGDIVYIGKSSDILKRVREHVKGSKRSSEGLKDNFTEISYCLCTEYEKDIYEVHAIYHYKPFYNIDMNKNEVNVKNYLY